jgi:hypothetical protein
MSVPHVLGPCATALQARQTLVDVAPVRRLGTMILKSYLKELHNYVYIQANEDTAHRGARSSRIDAEDVFPGRATKEYRDAPC